MLRVAASFLLIFLSAAGSPAGAGTLDRQSMANSLMASFIENMKRASTLIGDKQYEEAEKLINAQLEIWKRVSPPDNPAVISCLLGLGRLRYRQRRSDEAESFFQQVLAANNSFMQRQLHNTELAELAKVQALHGLADIYRDKADFDQAEIFQKRYMEEAKKLSIGGAAKTEVEIEALNDLATFYISTDKLAEAEPILVNIINESIKAYGAQSRQTIAMANNLAELYRLQDRLDEAERLSVNILAVAMEKFSKSDGLTVTIMNNVGLVFLAQGRFADAEELFTIVAANQADRLGDDAPETLAAFNNLAGTYLRQKKYDKALPIYMVVVGASVRVLGAGHPETINRINNLANLHFRQGDWSRAADLWYLGTNALIARSHRGVFDPGQARTGREKSEAEQQNWQFWELIKAVHRVPVQKREAAAGEMFRTAQWALGSEAAKSFAQMAARGAKNAPVLAEIVRSRQDLVRQWQKNDALRDAVLGRPDGDKKEEEAITARLAAADAKIADIDRRIASEFKDYHAFASPQALSAEDVQSQLRPNEALILFLDTPAWEPTPAETFVWAVTKTDMRWVRSELGTPELEREVQILRCGLDASAWDGEGWKKCRGFTNAEPQLDKDGNIDTPSLPFQLAHAHSLYKSLFGGVENLIEGKSLLIVPSGPLTQLPFQVLVTKPPQGGDYKSAAWLARDHALTVLPAASSLMALRREVRPSAAAKPMIGFGNPLLNAAYLLNGNPKHDAAIRARVQSAVDNQRCRDTPWQRLASLIGRHRGLAPVELRGGLANVEFLRGQDPLPETAKELCDVARDLHADLSEIRLGARANEREVKRLSESSQLAQYRIVHFATHGALAGQVQGNAEPGLLLTPPKEPSEEDDGYLTASEIAALKLDADWVILSACNTAAGGAQNAEALSGLARAFIYAQARALLVSHWEVNSEAAVTLITGAMSRLANDKEMGRAEAMRQSMLALIGGGKDYEAHPAFWAPFVLVGEGRAAK